MPKQENADGGNLNGIWGLQHGTAMARIHHVLRARKALRENGEIYTGVDVAASLGKLFTEAQTRVPDGTAPEVVPGDGTDKEETSPRPSDNGGEGVSWPYSVPG